MKNVVAKPLVALQPFIGEWNVEGRHVALPDTVIHGRSVFEWWGDRVFLVHHSTLDHADFPESMSLIGATQPDGGLAQHYFDIRGVYRLFAMTFSADGNTITAQSEARDASTHEMRPDFSVICTRAT